MVSPSVSTSARLYPLISSSLEAKACLRLAAAEMLLFSSYASKTILLSDKGLPTENDMLPRVMRRVSCRRMSLRLMGRVVMALAV